jgi:arsenite methyltransferase
LTRFFISIPYSGKSKFYGCGNPIPLGITGKHVLDLGSGSGRDCYIAAALVGENGSVTGIDMTEKQLKISTDYIQDFAYTLGYQPKMTFKHGHIENLEGILSLSYIISSNWW